MAAKNGATGKKVLVIGATGAVGQPLTEKLLAAGHEVVGTSRRVPSTQRDGLTWRELDLLDAEATSALVAQTTPDVIIDQATSLKKLGSNVRRFPTVFATTNRLRSEGTANVIAAAQQLDTAPQVVVQSFCGWTWAPVGGPVKSETDPVDPHPAAPFRPLLDAIVDLESQVAAYPRGVTLRYSFLYGPGTSMFPGGDYLEAIRKRRFPRVGDAGAYWSFIHVEDAADAAIAAMDAPPGLFNIVDDTPVKLNDWMLEVADMMGAPKPMRVPTWVGRMVGGPAMVHMMTQARGTSNAHAKDVLGWTPAHPDWKAGFAAMLEAPAPVA